MKMKKIFLCFILLNGINYISCFMSTLSQDLYEIGALIPVQDLFKIFNPNKFDPASHIASNYVASTNFQNSMYLLFSHSNLKQINNYLNINGVDLNKLLLQIIMDKEQGIRRKLARDKRPIDYRPIDSRPIDNRPIVQTQITTTFTFTTFIEQAYSVSQMDNIVSLVVHKTATSPSFRGLYELINTLKYFKVYADMIKVPKVKDMVVRLNEVGINTREVWRALSYLFGWNKATNIIALEEYEVGEETRDPQESALFQILRQYLNLIPKEKFIFLWRGLLVNPLFQEITVYIFNKQYTKILKKLDENQLIADFFDYLEDQGVSFVKFLDLIRDRLGFTFAYYKIPTGKYEENSHSFSLIQIFDLAKQILPLNEIRKLTTSLFKTSNEYKVLSDKIINLVFNNNVDLYFENQLEIRSTAMQYGFGINKLLNFIFLLIGVEYDMPERGKEFTESIYEFLDLIPKQDYLDLYHKYKNDTNIWKMVTYLKGPKFANFTGALFSTVEVKIFSNYLIKQYIPLKAILIDMFDRLGILQWWINYNYFCGNDNCIGAINPNSDNLYNFIDERINLFPLKEILILFHSKLQTSSYFQNLYLEISKIDGANLFKKITEHDVLRDFFVKITKIGYNFRSVVKHFSTLFGWGNLLTVDLSLNQTLENFDNLIYRKELFKLLDKYPDEVQQIKEMFKNSAFINSVSVFANLPSIRNIINWMQNLNVPIIDNFNYYFGQDTPNEFHLKLDSQLKWKKMTADIVNFLHKNKLFAFSVAQKYNSIEFHAFLEKIIYVDYNTIPTFMKHPDTRFVRDKLQSTGIDLQDVYNFLEDVENDEYDLHKQ